MTDILHIARTTQEVYTSINPEEALESDDPRYVPLETARGIKNVAEELTNRILAQDKAVASGSASKCARFLVTGHRGCGKTTELNRLRQRLTHDNFAVVYFDAEVELNLQELNWWNVLLEMVFQINDQLASPPYHLALPNDLLDEATLWLARAVTKKVDKKEVEHQLDTEFSIEPTIPFFAKVKAAAKSLIKANSSVVKEIEQTAERRPDDLLDAVDDILKHVKAALTAKGKRGLVVIVDGLEKIPLRTLGEQLTAHNSCWREKVLG